MAKPTGPPQRNCIVGQAYCREYGYRAVVLGPSELQCAAAGVAARTDGPFRPLEVDGGNRRRCFPPVRRASSITSWRTKQSDGRTTYATGKPTVTTQRRSKQHGARSIRTKRDFEGAAAAAKRLAGQSERDTAAELRLQRLLKELDKFDLPEDELDADLSLDDYPGPGRRWSDETSERD